VLAPQGDRGVSIAELERELDRLGIALEVREGRLGARGNVAALTEELRAGIAEHRAALERSRWSNVDWIKQHMKGIYGLIKEALEAGYLAPAQQVLPDVVEAVRDVARQDGDVARACRLLSRSGAGNDVAAAALLATYEQLCRALGEAGVDPLRRRAAVALLLARAQEGRADVVVRPDGTRGR
jgi:TubC N-terminal docking domain